MTDLAQRLNEAERDQSHPNLRPRDAATLILIDRSGPLPKVLLGRRSERHAFMPGKFVFPGGRVETADRAMPFASPLHPRVESRLMRQVVRPSAAKARAYALAAIRETFEEAGLLIGTRRRIPPAVPSEHWVGFSTAGVHPDLEGMHFIARAITPPRRLRRFDTRFFAADLTAVAHRIDGITGPDAELVELVWILLGEARRLDLPAITGVVLDELEARIAAGFGHELPVPFYRVLHRRFVRTLL